MIPHLASSVISTVKTNFIKWETRVIDHENQQISVQNRLRKLKGNELTRLSQRKRYGNTKQCVHFQLTRFPSKPPCGNATEFWTIRFPQHFRIAETPYFTPCITTEFRFTHGANYGLRNVFIYVSRYGPTSTGMGYRSLRAKFANEGDKASQGKLVPFMRN